MRGRIDRYEKDNYETKKLEKLATLFGKLRITYTGNTYVTVLNGHTTTNNFRIVETGANYVLIEDRFGTEELLKEDIMVTNRIDFTSDGYWVTSTIARSPFKEKFIRKDNPSSCR